MLDSLPAAPAMTGAWRDHLSHGDIVLFRFPLAEETGTTKPKARPCLVLEVEAVGDQRLALLAYGTTSHRRANVGYEIRVHGRTAYQTAGLDGPTRFVGARRLLVPLNHSGFLLHSESDSPVVGRLSGAALERMNAVRGRIHAERDIAAERRQTRVKRRRPAIRGRDFVVERRRAPAKMRPSIGERT